MTITLEQLVLKYKSKDLSGQDIVALTGKQPVLYSDLRKYTSLQQLCGPERACIVLYQTSQKTEGHFVCLSINRKGVARFVDPYGLQNGTEKIYGASYDANMPRYIENLLAPYKDRDMFEHSKIDYQAKNPNVSTCGRWSSIFFLWKDLSLVEIQQLLLYNKDPFMANTDNCAVLLTLLGLSNIREFFDKS